MVSIADASRRASRDSAWRARILSHTVRQTAGARIDSRMPRTSSCISSRMSATRCVKSSALILASSRRLSSRRNRETVRPACRLSLRCVRLEFEVARAGSVLFGIPRVGVAREKAPAGGEAIYHAGNGFILKAVDVPAGMPQAGENFPGEPDKPEGQGPHIGGMGGAVTVPDDAAGGERPVESVRVGVFAGVRMLTVQCLAGGQGEGEVVDVLHALLFAFSGG